MNTIQVTILLAPLCGHQTRQEDCWMCRNLQRQANELLNKVHALRGSKTSLGVAISLEAYEDDRGDATEGKKVTQ